MHQIKIFKGVESDLMALEAEVNQWLSKTNARVVNMLGNIAPQSAAAKPEVLSMGEFPPSDVLLVMVYEATI